LEVVEEMNPDRFGVKDPLWVGEKDEEALLFRSYMLDRRLVVEVIATGFIEVDRRLEAGGWEEDADAGEA
jgi:hypothetical protein